MKRTTFMIPSDLKEQAARLARERGISLGQLLREALESVLEESRARERLDDPLFTDWAVWDGDVPADLSENHDKYLYDEDEEG